MGKANGGPAFPWANIYCNDTGHAEAAGNNGMSLRDWLAGMTLQGLLADQVNFCDWSRIARDAYAAADAMLAQREKEVDDG